MFAFFMFLRALLVAPPRPGRLHRPDFCVHRMGLLPHSRQSDSRVVVTAQPQLDGDALITFFGT